MKLIQKHKNILVIFNLSYYLLSLSLLIVWLRRKNIRINVKNWRIKLCWKLRRNLGRILNDLFKICGLNIFRVVFFGVFFGFVFCGYFNIYSINLRRSNGRSRQPDNIQNRKSRRETFTSTRTQYYWTINCPNKNLETEIELFRYC